MALQESTLKQELGDPARGETTSRSMPMYSTFKEFLAHTYANPSPLRFLKSPRAKLKLIPKKGLGLSFKLPLETTLAQTETREGASIKPIQVDLESPSEEEVEPGSRDYIAVKGKYSLLSTRFILLGVLTGMGSTGTS